MTVFHRGLVLAAVFLIIAAAASAQICITGGFGYDQLGDYILHVKTKSVSDDDTERWRAAGEFGRITTEQEKIEIENSFWQTVFALSHWNACEVEFSASGYKYLAFHEPKLLEFDYNYGKLWIDEVSFNSSTYKSTRNPIVSVALLELDLDNVDHMVMAVNLLHHAMDNCIKELNSGNRIGYFNGFDASKMTDEVRAKELDARLATTGSRVITYGALSSMTDLYRHQFLTFYKSIEDKTFLLVPSQLDTATALNPEEWSLCSTQVLADDAAFRERLREQRPNDFFMYAPRLPENNPEIVAIHLISAYTGASAAYSWIPDGDASLTLAGLEAHLASTAERYQKELEDDTE